MFEKDCSAKRGCQLIYAPIREAGEALLDRIRTRDFRVVYQTSWNRAHGSGT